MAMERGIVVLAICSVHTERSRLPEGIVGVGTHLAYLDAPARPPPVRVLAREPAVGVMSRIASDEVLSPPRK